MNNLRPELRTPVRSLEVLTVLLVTVGVVLQAVQTAIVLLNRLGR
jgi:hypothetical protein